MHNLMRNDSGSQNSTELYQSIFDAAGDGLLVVDGLTGCVVLANPAAATMYHYSGDELVGLPVSRLMSAENYKELHRYIQGDSSEVYAHLAVHTPKEGAAVHVEARWSRYSHRQRMSVLGVLRDVSARVRNEQALQRQVEIHMLEQASLLEISQTLASGLELKPDLILNQLRMLTEYAHAELYELRDSTLVALAMNGSSHWEQVVPFEVALDDMTYLTPLITERQPYRIADIQSNEPAARFIRALLSGHEALLEGVRAFMWVPMRVKDRVMGAISMVHAKDGFFTSHHADLSLIIANQAAITMFNAQLYEHAQTLAKLHERQRLGQELHDAVNQSLFSAGLIADVLPRLWEQNPEEGRRSLNDLRLLMRGALAEMRGLLAELRPTIMTGTDFGDLIRQLSGALAGRINIPVEAVIHGQGVLPADVQATLYRLSQEALSNVAKHAQASRVNIQLDYGPDTVVLRIADDGRGFEPEHVMEGHSGLSMMHERAEAIGVQLTVKSEMGQGCTIEVRWSEIKKRKRAR